MSVLFRDVVNASFYGSIIILTVLLLRLVLRKAPKKYICLLWVLAGLRLLCPIEIESGFSLQPDLDPLTDIRAETPSQRVQVDWTQYTPAVPEDAVMPEDAAVEYGDAFEAVTPGTVAEEPKQTVIDYAEAAAWVWLTVACGLGIYSFASYLGLKRRVREAVILSGNVWECPGLETAFVLGFLRPRIYIPMGLSGESRAFILDHERAHLKRGDHWVKLVGFIALVVHWFNPLVWVAYILLSRDIEMACDESVVKNMALEQRKAYSAALLRCGTGHRTIVACPVAFGEVSVKQRIVSVLNYRKPRFWLSIAAIAAVVFVAVCFLTSPEEKDSEGWKAQCRAVLEEIQSRDAYYILEDRAFEGENSLVDGVCRNLFGSGGSWMCINYYEDMHESQQYVAYLGIGDAYYDSVSSDLNFEWQETDPRDVAVVVPWLYSFDLDAQETKAISRQSAGEGYIIRLKVYAPSGFEEIDSDSYHVDFYFEQDGNFRYAIQYVYGDDDESIITTMYAPEATEGQILSTMSKYAGDLARRELDVSLGTAAVETEEPLGIYLGGETVQTGAPDWGITLETANATPSTVTLYITQAKDLAPQKLYYTNHYTVERWEDGGWTALERHFDEDDFALEATLIPQNQTTRLDIDLTCFYYQQPAGRYRLCMEITNYVPYKSGAGVDADGQPLEELCCTWYAEFEIPGHSVAFADDELGALMPMDGEAIISAYVSTQEGYALLSRDDEITEILELLKNVRYDPEATGKTADPEDYNQNYKRIQFNNPYVGPYLQFDENCETAWAFSDGEVTAVYAVEDPGAVRALFERFFDPVKDKNVTVSAFATRDEPWTWAQNISLDAVEAVYVATQQRTRIAYGAQSSAGSGGAMRTSRFEELLQILGGLTKDAFVPKEMEGGHSLNYLIYGHDVDWATSVTIADGANHETVVLRCLGEEMELVFCGDTGGVVEGDSLETVALESLQCWTIEDETLLAYMQDLMYHCADVYYYHNPDEIAAAG